MDSTAEEVTKESTENVLPETSAEEKTPTPPPQEAPKKLKKEDRSKKDDKNVEQFMKSLSSVPSFEEKLSLVSKKYIHTSEENKKLQFYIKQSDKRYALLVKEREHVQHEYNKLILKMSKLENLCRELQKQNKAIKEESTLKIREEEERRKDTQGKFQNTLTEITALLQQNNEKNTKLREDNISMTEKFRSVVQQYQLREQQVEKMAKQMALESQLSDAKLKKAALEHQAEKERLLADMETFKVTIAQFRAKNMELQGNETALKGQLAVYTDKYDEFQNALVKSNQVFGGFKEQMEKMSKKIQKLEKESLSWKKRWETSQTALLDMCGERQISEEKAAVAGRHLQQMQSLCRTLQAERTVLLNTLKENNIDRPPLPTPPPAPAAPPASAPAPSNAKVDAMAANCVQLRQSLAHLQSQLNVLTNKKEESPKPEKPKKSKSKKNKSEKAQKACLETNEVKETEAEASSKESSAESQPSEVRDDQNVESREDKIDSKTMESLIQAINMANLNLCDLGDGERQDDVAETEKTEVVEEINTDVPADNSKLLIDILKENSQLVLEPPKDKIDDVTIKDNKKEENVPKDIAEPALSKESNFEAVIAKDDTETIKEVISEIDKVVDITKNTDELELISNEVEVKKCLEFLNGESGNNVSGADIKLEDKKEKSINA